MLKTYEGTCECCQLKHFLVETDVMSRQGLRLCEACHGHRGSGDEQRLKRTEKHESMLRERMLAAYDHVKQAEAERDDHRGRTASALRSRDRGVRLMQQLNDLHILRADGHCSCGAKRDCKSAALLYTPWAQQLIRRQDERDDHARRMMEIGSLDDDDDWIRDDSPPAPRRSHTA